MSKYDVLAESFGNEISEFGFFESYSDEYFVKYRKDDLEIQIFFGRYSDRPDIYVRYEDEDIPEQYSTASMLFFDELEDGIGNSLKDLDDSSRLKRISEYFIKNYKTMLEKSICKAKKSKLDDFLSRNFQ